VLGTFAIYQHDAHYPTGANIAIIEQTAGLSSIAIKRIQAEEDLNKRNDLFQQVEKLASWAIGYGVN